MTIFKMDDWIMNNPFFYIFLSVNSDCVRNCDFKEEMQIWAVASIKISGSKKIRMDPNIVWYGCGSLS